MTRDDLSLLEYLGFTGSERQVRAALRASGLFLCLLGGALLMKHLGWWPKQPQLWIALGMVSLGFSAFVLARKSRFEKIAGARHV